MTRSHLDGHQGHAPSLLSWRYGALSLSRLFLRRRKQHNSLHHHLHSFLDRDLHGTYRVTMSKRKVSDAFDESDKPVKRWRATTTVDRLSALSHELILRVLSYLPVLDLIVCQRYVP